MKSHPPLFLDSVYFDVGKSDGEISQVVIGVVRVEKSKFGMGSWLRHTLENGQ